MSYIQAGGNSVACPSFIGNTSGSGGSTPANGYVAEDDVTAYVDESGLVFYVQET